MTLTSASDDARPKNFAELSVFIKGDRTLSDGRRRDLLSAISSAARMLNRHPKDLSVDFSQLRPMLARIHPVQQGVSRKRLANVRADLKSALKRASKTRRPLHRGTFTPTAGWREVLARLPNEWQRYVLSCFVRFCCEQRLEPRDVNDEALERFRAALHARELTKDPNRTVLNVLRTWNGAVQKTSPTLSRLTPPPRKDRVCRPLGDYPVSFQQDLEGYLSRLGHADLLSEEGPINPLRPLSIRNTRAAIRQFADALVTEGVPIDTITCLERLVCHENFRTGLRHFLGRNGGKPPTWLGGMAGQLIAIARHHVKLDHEAIARLKDLQIRVRRETPGFTDKNRARLAQFDDAANLGRLFDLPTKLMQAAGRQPKSTRSALNALCAVAIEVLLVCPIRVGNLSALSTANMRWSGPAKKRRLSLFIPSSEVKNRVAIEADLPQESVGLIEIYLRDWRHLLADDPGDWLFPARSGPRSASSLSTSLAQIIFRETGLRMNAHLFRHLAGALFLKQMPGQFEVVRQLLGHRKGDTTLRFYASLNGKWSVQRYDAVVLSKIRGRT